MDAGWFSNGDWWPSVGEWQICEERFDGRIDEVFARIREKGMVPGIWLEPEVMGVDCPLVPGIFRLLLYLSWPANRQ